MSLFDETSDRVFGARQPQGRAARDAALEQVAGNSEPWHDQAIRLLRRIRDSTGTGMTGEDINQFVTRQIGQPHHHNAKGALIMSAVKAGIIAPTDEYRPMRNTRSHARRTRVYRVMTGDKP